MLNGIIKVIEKLKNIQRQEKREKNYLCQFKRYKFLLYTQKKKKTIDFAKQILLEKLPIFLCNL